MEVFTQTQINQNIPICEANEKVCHKIQSKPKAQIKSNGKEESINKGYLKLLN
jgi:hypothetical protein